jgi:TRAP-type mannitol/chloroaromatic compound transport system permease small subunit
MGRTPPSTRTFRRSLRAPDGIPAEILAKLGASVCVMPGTEVYTALDTGKIEATDWSTLSVNDEASYNRIAPYAIYPGIHSMNSMDFVLSKRRWDALSAEQKAIVLAAVDQWSLRTWVDRAIEAIAKVLSYSFALSVVVTIYDVVLDVAFHSPTVWVYDVVTAAIAVAFLVGGSYALMRRDHIRITVMYNRLSTRWRLRCDIATSVLAIVYLAAFSWFAFVMARISIEDWEVGGSAWAQPTPIVVKVAMLLGALLMIVQMISNIVGDLRALRAED